MLTDCGTITIKRLTMPTGSRNDHDRAVDRAADRCEGDQQHKHNVMGKRWLKFTKQI